MIITFPDYQGIISRFGKSFPERLFANVPTGTAVIPVVNAPGMADRHKQEAIDAGLRRGLTPVGANGGGLSRALITGYRAAIYRAKLSGGHAIMRMDPSEHRPESIMQLVCATTSADLVIGDLDFSGGGLTPGSYDERAHKVLFPALFREFTDGELELSAAHGFMILASEWLCEACLAKAEEIYRRTEMQIGHRLQWGFDTAMIMAAFKLGLRIAVSPVPAEVPRNRPRQKIVDQFDTVARICAAATDRDPSQVIASAGQG